MLDGFTDYIFVTIDLQRPHRPELVGRWLPGMNQAAGETPDWDASRWRYGLHHAIVNGDTAHASWRDGGLSILDVSDRVDAVALDAIRRYLPQLGLAEDAQAWLLAVTDAQAGAEAELAGFEQAFRAYGALAVQRADSAAELDGLFEARRALNPALRALRGSSLNGDISVPRARLAEFTERLGQLAIGLDVVIAVGGHVGDGNLHPVLAYNGDGPQQTLAAHEARDRILRLAQELGGSMTGEHGVGVEKLSELDGELPARVRDIQRAIKAMFDPNGILNPGKKY